MIKVRVTSATPVIVGHRQLLPDEAHEVAGGDLNAAVVLYGADAFRILDGAPVVAPKPPVAPKPVDGDDAGADVAGDAVTEGVTDDAAEPVSASDEAAPASQRNRRKG